jgi:hypothetical protein
MAKFSINMDDKPNLSALKDSDKQAFKDVVGTFVNLMEVAAENKWHELPKAIHTSLSFSDVVTGVLNGVMTTENMESEAFKTLGHELHPLSLLSDTRLGLLTKEHEPYDWRTHFGMDSERASEEAVEKIIRKLMYLVRWFDLETVSKALITQQFPVIDGKDVRKLPFQPALKYQRTHLGELFIGRFFHELGAFDCGTIEDGKEVCPACNIGVLMTIHEHKICPRCNGGWKISEENTAN